MNFTSVSGKKWIFKKFDTADINEFSTIATSESIRGTVLNIVATTGNELFSSTLIFDGKISSERNSKE